VIDESPSVDAGARRLMDLIEVGYCLAQMILDGDGNPVDARFLETNAAFASLVAMPEPVGRTILEMAPDVGREWVDRYAPLVRDGSSIRYEQYAPAIDRWFEVFATPLGPPDLFALVFTDQTARRRSEDALRDSESRFRTMADDLPLMLWEHGASGEQTWVNNTFCRFFGTTREEMRDDRWQMLTHPDDTEAYAHAFGRAVAEQQPFQGRVRARDAAGEWRWLDSWAQPRFDEQGGFLGMVGASADVTELVESRARVRSSEAFTRRILDNLFSYVAVLSTSGAVLEVNRTPLALIGIRIDDVVGRPFWECPWWDGSEEVSQRLQDAIARALDGETVRYDIQATARGEPIWVDFQVAPLTDDAGEVTHLVASGHDVTVRYETEERLAAALAAERRARRRVELLERTATHLAAASTQEDIAAAMLADLEESLDVRIAAVDVRDGDDITTPAIAGLPPLPQRWLQDDLPGPTAIATNETIVLNARDAIVERFPRLAPLVHRMSLESVGAFPLRNVAGDALGALVVGLQEPNGIDDSLRSLLTGLAGQAGQALERAELHHRVVENSQREHEIAVQFQRAMLPSRLVAHPAVEIAAGYDAVGDLLAVGGDWYDTHLWDDRYLGVTVGDVMGHDVAAATRMGRVRIAARALMATVAPDPGAVLRLHDDCVLEHRTYATAASVVLDVDTGVVRCALAGHPPPLMIDPDGGVTWLGDRPAPPLGFWQDDTDPPVGEWSMHPGSVLVLYSDGLVERRTEVIDAGLDRLATAAARATGTAETAGGIADRLMAELTESGMDDDVVVTCVRWMPPA
jgi:PAS domain S-box-containing protein